MGSWENRREIRSSYGDVWVISYTGAELCRLLFSHKSQRSWVVKILRRGFMAVEFLFLYIYFIEV